MKCSIKREGLVNIIDVDGKSVFPSAYMTYSPNKKYFDEFKSAGIKLFMFPVYAGDEGINPECGSRPFADNFFKGYGEYDFSPVERVLNMIAPSGKEDVYIIPRICLEPPLWWQKMNPEELSADYGGEKIRESFTSQKWLEDMAVALRALIDYINSSKWAELVIGYHVAAGGTEEWTYQSRYSDQYYDYSKVNLKAYRKYLQIRYNGDISALNEAHNEEHSSFEDIEFPTPVEREYAVNGILRSPEKERAVLDYYDFHNESVADAIIYFCKAVKDYTGGERICGVFYGYVVTMPHNKKGLHALSKVLSSPYVDFISTTNNDMLPGQAWNFSSAVHSALLHGKAWICEGDIRTSKTSYMKDTMPQSLPDNDYYESDAWKPLPTMAHSVSAITKALARLLTAPAGIWWFDMFSGWFSSPEMMNIIEKCAPLISEQKEELLKPEVALIIDERGYKYFGLTEGFLPSAVWELCKTLSHMGAPYHIYLQSDITRDDFPADDYKLYIFQSSVDPSPEEKADIERKLKNKNKTLLWLYCSAAFDKGLSGFSLSKAQKHSTAVYDGEEYGCTELPILQFNDPEGYVLSRHTDSSLPACVWQKRKGYNSVHSVHLDISSRLLRKIALLSGVHLYNLDGDVIYAGGNFAGIHSADAGYRRIALPSLGFKAYDAITGEALTVNGNFIDLKMQKYETRLIKLEME